MAHSMDDLLVRQVDVLVSEIISMAFWPEIAPKSKGSPPRHLQAVRPREFKRVWSTGRLFVL
jgi:hypothetical protein